MSDGTEQLIDAATDDDVRRAMRDDKVTSVELHKPGSIITHSDGTRYQVSKSGAWVRLDKKRRGR